MNKKFTEKELKVLASQLGCPTGKNGIALAIRMNEMNIEMTKETIKNLAINHQQTVLELGHGNCGHLAYLLQQAKKIAYTGLEISETMQQEAQRQHTHLLSTTNPPRFICYDGEKIPFSANSFDRIMSVNNIYFWKKPEKLLKEIYRVLQTSGIFVVTYGQKSCMEKFPVVKHNFKLFDKNRIETLVNQTAFTLIDITEKVDKTIGADGKIVERKYAMAKMLK